MYCRRCGNEITDNSAYCQHCGAPVRDTTANTIQNGTITFYREKAAAAKLVSAKIKVNGKPYGEIKENERCTATLPYGTHFVEIKAAMNPAATFSISINSENTTHYFPFKINAMGKAVPSGQPKEKMLKKQSKKKPIYKRKWFWVIVVFFLIVAIGNSGSKSDTERSSGQKKNDNALVEDEGNKIIDLEFDAADYHILSPDVLLEYGQYMGGEKVLTRLEVTDVNSSNFQSHTANEEALRYSFVCDFDSTTVNKQLEKGSLVTLAGTISDKSDEKTVRLTDCKIVSDEKYSQESDESAQVEYAAAFKTSFEEAVAAELKAERDEYVSACVNLAYDDTARNPDSHKGEKVKFSGKVIQVSEGLLDSVIYRIATKNGYENVVYVTYTRHDGESRILENDSITVYGECNGVTSYLSVLGGTITIPSVKMQYYTAQ